MLQLLAKLAEVGEIVIEDLILSVSRTKVYMSLGKIILCKMSFVVVGVRGEDGYNIIATLLKTSIIISSALVFLIVVLCCPCVAKNLLAQSSH